MGPVRFPIGVTLGITVIRVCGYVNTLTVRYTKVAPKKPVFCSQNATWMNQNARHRFHNAGVGDSVNHENIGGSTAYHAKEDFVNDFMFPWLQAGAIYERKYLLWTSMARPVIAKAMVDVMKEVGVDVVSHGYTGKGNDQRAHQFVEDQRLRQELQARIMGSTYGGQSLFYGSTAAEFWERYGQPCNNVGTENATNFRGERRMATEGKGLYIKMPDNEDAWVRVMKYGHGNGAQSEGDKNKDPVWGSKGR